MLRERLYFVYEVYGYEPSRAIFTDFCSIWLQFSLSDGLEGNEIVRKF